MSQASSLRAVLYALGANSGILIAKGTAAAVTGSSAMLAEAIHSAADCGNQVLLLRGMKEAKREPDAKHPLGYGKVVYFWAFLVAVLLFTLGGLFSVYEGWHKLHQPEPMSNAVVAIIVLAVSIVLEAFSLAGCVREIRKVSGGMSLWKFFRVSRNSELIIVLGEDIAALAGLALALIAILLALATGNPMFDALGQHRRRRVADRRCSPAVAGNQGPDHRRERGSRNRKRDSHFPGGAGAKWRKSTIC